MSLHTETIRNVAVVGHGETGKTSLCEQLLFRSGVIAKPERVESRRTVSDYTPEEGEHQISIRTGLLRLPWNETTLNLLDCPGVADFVGEVIAALRVAESSLLLIGARAGIEIESIKLWRRIVGRKMPLAIFISKMDEEYADFGRVLQDLQGKFSADFVPLTLPMGAGSDYAGVIDLLSMRACAASDETGEIPDRYLEMSQTARERLVEAAAEGNDELTGKFLDAGTLADEDVMIGLREAYRAAKFVPVLCGAALQDSGMSTLLNCITALAPSPMGIAETASDEQQQETVVAISDAGDFSALCFKTVVDQFSGRISCIKVMTGELSTDSEFLNMRTGDKERTPRPCFLNGKKLTDTNHIVAGDIGALTRIESARTNDTFCSLQRPISFRALALPQPVYQLALRAADRKQEDKLAGLLHRAAEEDPTFSYHYDSETKDAVIAGMGEFHLNIIMTAIREQQKIALETSEPRIAYRETITKRAEAVYRHKKQSGGHGQFGEVSIKIIPLERGQDYKFENLIRGMAVSKGYMPGIEKGLRETMSEGVLAGYQLVDIGVQLTDGKEHSVDSSEMAFKLAAKGAMKEAVLSARPILLEPVMDLEVIIEERHLGDVLSDLNAKRGRILGQDALGSGFLSIKAQAPQAELRRYAIDLRSITSGTGSFELEFNHYSPISGRVAEGVIAAARQSAAE